MKINVSFIIPAYNIETYLPRCIESILAQSYTDYEIILIDDGSNDKTGLICDEYSASHPCIKVFHQENKGLSAARNKGIDIAFGKWFWFVDGDDYLEDDTLKHLIKLTESEDYDMIVSGYDIINEEKDNKNKMFEHFHNKLTFKDMLIELYAPENNKYPGYAWNKLFRASIIKNKHLRFNEKIYYNEDRLFIVNYLCASQKDVTFTPLICYNYCLRNNSLMGTSKKTYNRKYATDFDAFVSMYELIKNTQTKPTNIKYAKIGIAFAYMTHHRKMKESHCFYADIHKHQLQELYRTGAWVQYVILTFKNAIKQILKLTLPAPYQK